VHKLIVIRSACCFKPQTNECGARKALKRRKNVQRKNVGTNSTPVMSWRTLLAKFGDH